MIQTLALASSSLAQKGDAPSPPAAQRDDYDQLRVGDAADGRIVVPTNQVLTPLGRQVGFAGRPTDVALSPSGRWLGVLGNKAVSIVDVEVGKIVSQSPFKGSYAGIVFAADGKKLLASNMGGAIGVFGVSDAGALTALPPIEPTPAAGSPIKTALPVGLALDSAGNTLWAVLNLKNSLAKIDVATREVVQEIAVGNAPFGVVLVESKTGGAKAYVSNWAGRMPQPGDRTGPSGRAAAVRVDEHGIADDGSVSVVDLAKGQELKQIPVGLHPAGIVATPDGRYVCVANANSDTVSVIDTARDEVVETIPTRPAKNLLFGSTPNALAISPDGKLLYVSNGTNNAVLVVALSAPRSRLLGSIPTAWYPAGLALDAQRKRLYVANVKGTGSRNTSWEGKRVGKGKVVFGYNSHDHSGSVSLIDLPADAELPALTQKVLENNRLTEAVSALAPPRADAPPRPLPRRHGEPSVDQARALHHQGEPDVRPGVWRHRAGRRRCRSVHFRPRGDAQPPQAGRRVCPARQFLLQRRAQCRRTSVDRRSLCDRLHRKRLWRVSPQLSLRRRRRPGLRQQRLSLGQRAGRITKRSASTANSSRPASAGKRPGIPPGQPFSIAIATLSTAPA